MTEEERSQRPVKHCTHVEKSSGSDARMLADGPRVITVDELATLLRLERKTVYAAIQRGEIPGVQRISRSIRISRSTVEDWLAGKS